MSKRRTKTPVEALTTSGSPAKKKRSSFATKTVEEENFPSIEVAREIDARRTPQGLVIRAWKVEDGVKFLSQADQTLGKWVREKKIPTHLSRPDEGLVPQWFPSLFRTIISQQLAGAAAETIHKKSLEAFGVKEGEEITVSRQGWSFHIGPRAIFSSCSFAHQEALLQLTNFGLRFALPQS